MSTIIPNLSGEYQRYIWYNTILSIKMIMKLHQKALLLSYVTVGYNIIEGIASVFAGLLAGSTALVGFGSDSFVESLSGSVMIWRFRKHEKISEGEEEQIEKQATKFVAITFFILGIYVLYASVKKLYLQEKPEPSPIGMLIATASVIIMPVLYYLKYQIGKAIKSKSLIADSKQTLACLFMSISLLIGLGLNYLYEFWQADPLVGLLIAGFLIKEGYTTFTEEKICSC